MKLLLLAVLSGAVSAYVTAPKTFVTSRPSTKLSESFGFDFAVDSYSSQDDRLAGETAYKQWINKVADDPFLNRQYNVIRRVRELNLLKATADAGVLSKLEANGVDLATIEKVLPVAEQLGLLSLVGNNQQLLVNGVAPVVVEGAPILLPLVAGALGVGPSAFYGAAAVFAGLEVALLANNVELPFVGLSAGVVLGLLLVPLTIVSGGVGYALSAAAKK